MLSENPNFYKVRMLEKNKKLTKGIEDLIMNGDVFSIENGMINISSDKIFKTQSGKAILQINQFMIEVPNVEFDGVNYIERSNYLTMKTIPKNKIKGVLDSYIKKLEEKQIFRDRRDLTKEYDYFDKSAFDKPIIVGDGGLYGLVDRYGIEIQPPIFDEVLFIGNKHILLTSDHLSKIINYQNNEIYTSNKIGTLEHMSDYVYRHDDIVVFIVGNRVLTYTVGGRNLKVFNSRSIMVYKGNNSDEYIFAVSPSEIKTFKDLKDGGNKITNNTIEYRGMTIGRKDNLYIFNRETMNVINRKFSNKIKILEE